MLFDAKTLDLDFCSGDHGDHSEPVSLENRDNPNIHFQGCCET